KANKISFRYIRASDGKVFEKEILPPECPYFQKRTIASLAPFTAKSYSKSIQEIAFKHGKNPALLAGLVAQESSFQTTAVSYARALGLTQITPIANLQIKEETRGWPRYPRLEEMNYFTLKTLISNGKINSHNDWRLDSKLSLEGGALY